MKPPFTSLAFFAALAIGQIATAAGLEMTIRAHTRHVVFGDPLYLEVTIVNRGKEVVTAPKPHPFAPGFDFKLYDPQTWLTFSAGNQGAGFFGGGSSVEYEPDKPVTFYRCIFLPLLTLRDHKFWKPKRDGGSVLIYAQYGLAPGLLLRSNRVDVGISQRKESEMLLLEHYAQTEVLGYEAGPSPTDLGIKFQSLLNMKDTRTIGANLRGGGIARHAVYDGRFAGSFCSGPRRPAGTDSDHGQ